MIPNEYSVPTCSLTSLFQMLLQLARDQVGPLMIRKSQHVDLHLAPNGPSVFCSAALGTPSLHGTLDLLAFASAVS
jgi:hypothetical protein